MQLDPELYREKVEISPNTTLSLIDIRPQAPLQTLVFVHGFGGNARQWQYQIEEFADRYRVLAPDMRGHGRSRTRSTDFSMERLLADLEAVLVERDVKSPFVLVGHSFGGAIATEFAAAHPDRVSRLVLIATAGEYELVWTYRAAFRLPVGFLQFVQPAVSRFVDASIVSLQRFYRQTLSAWRGWSLFETLKVPTLVVTGERDRVFPQAAFERVAEVVPGAELINVGVSAHMVMLERRDAVNRAMQRFMEAGARFSGWRDEREPGVGRLLAERPWLVHYESNVPHTLDIPNLPLTRLFERACQRFARRPALVFQGRKLFFFMLKNHVDRMAAALSRLGVTKGTSVMLLLPNTPHLVVAYYAILQLGGTVVMSNPLSKEDELVQQAEQSEAQVVITLAELQKKALSIKGRSGVRHLVYGQVPDYLPWQTRLLMLFRPGIRAKYRPALPLGSHESLWSTLLRGLGRVPAPRIELTSQDRAVIQFTGGTTDRPRGVTLSHGNLVANTLQTRVWLADTRDGEEVVLAVVPFSHVYGMTAALNLSIYMGAMMVLLPRFETEEVLEHVRRYRPTFFPGVPRMYMAINRFPQVRRYDIASIRACLSGAAPLPIEVKERFEKLTRGRLVEGYGLSEASPVTHANPVFGLNKIGSIGIPLPNTEARVVDLQTGVPLPAGQIGELLVRGPQVMQGYWNDPRATREVLGPDGWLRTNDIARVDEDGYFQIISRRQDMWQTDDRSVAFPRDVEEVIYELPQVNEVIVVGVGNRPVAFVNIEEGAWLPAATIIAYCERRLPADRVPRRIIFVRDFPRSFVGKVLRRELVSQYAHRIEPEAGTVGQHLQGLQESEADHNGASGQA